MTDILNDYEKFIIQTLRQDAKDVKDSYTRYSFQAIAFSSTVLAIIAAAQKEVPVIALASVASIVLLITVARIGVYKYGTGFYRSCLSVLWFFKSSILIGYGNILHIHFPSLCFWLLFIFFFMIMQGERLWNQDCCQSTQVRSCGKLVWLPIIEL